MPDDPMNAAIFKALSDPVVDAKLTDAINAYTRDKMRFIEHIPNKYMLPALLGDPEEREAAAAKARRLAEELRDKGRIEMHPDGWTPLCLVEAGLEPAPERRQRETPGERPAP